MNCQDIARIVDTGGFGGLSEAERDAAEAHALSCRSCAPAWGVHSRLARLRIAPMPAELAVRCRTMAALPARAQDRPSLRRLTVVGGLVALAAAAGILAIRIAGTPDPGLPPFAGTTTQVTAPDQTSASEVVPAEVPAGSAVAPSLPMPEESTQAQPPALPLLPMPAMLDVRQRYDTLQIAVARHPELVEGPAMDGVFAVGILMRADGSVISSTAQPAKGENIRAVSADLERTLPRDGGVTFNVNRSRDTSLPDGRSLRADVRMRIAMVPDGYDLLRSNVRVLEILGDRYADLMLPAVDGHLNRLTVFLAEDGSIQREKVGRESANRQNSRTFRADDPNDVASMAERIASQLELDVGQIGLFGMTSLENGTLTVVMDEFGNSRADDKRRMLLVEYAWPRREGEAGPRWGQGSVVGSQRSKVDPATALLIVERVIPEAFAPRDPAMGSPTVVLTAKGEFIRAGHVLSKPYEPVQKSLQDQLVPGVQFGYFTEVRLTDKSGAATDVIFAWEAPLAGAVSP
jgi:hypothetical protein